MQEYPVSQESVCLDLDAISSGDLEVSNSGAPCVSPVVVIDQEFTIISAHSSDTDPDSSDEGYLSDSQSVTVSPIPTKVSGHVVESPSHYPAPAETVELSAVSSVLISPSRVREDCSSVSLDVYPVYEVSPDTMGCVPSTAPRGTYIVHSLVASVGSGVSPSSGGGVLACDLSLLDRGTDLSFVAIPLFPLPAGMLLVPLLPSDQPSTSPEFPSRREQQSRAVSPSGDLSREGPLDAYCAPLDTADHPLVSKGCRVAPIE